MGTIYPAQVKNIGPRVAVTWTDAILETVATDPAIAAITLGSPYVSMDAWDGGSNNFSVGGTIDLRFGNAGNPLDSVIIPAGPNTAAGVAALINAVHPNGAFVIGGKLRLFDLNYVEVNNIGTVLGSELGLSGSPTRPAVKDITVTAATSRVGDFNLQLDRNDLFSNPVAVPDGANSMSVWVTTKCVTNVQAECQNPTVLLTFSNGIDLNPPDKFLLGFGGISDPTNPTYPGPSFSVRVNSKLVMGLFPGTPSIGAVEIPVGHPPFEIVIPPGVTTMRVGIISTSFGPTLPIIPPIIEAMGITFGAR